MHIGGPSSKLHYLHVGTRPHNPNTELDYYEGRCEITDRGKTQEYDIDLFYSRRLNKPTLFSMKSVPTDVDLFFDQQGFPEEIFVYKYSPGRGHDLKTREMKYAASAKLGEDISDVQFVIPREAHDEIDQKAHWLEPNSTTMRVINTRREAAGLLATHIMAVPEIVGAALKSLQRKEALYSVS